MIKMDQIKRFEIDKKYSGGGYIFKVIKRTKKTIWLINESEPQKMIQKRVLVSGGINRVELTFFRAKNVNEQYFELNTFKEVIKKIK